MHDPAMAWYDYRIGCEVRSRSPQRAMSLSICAIILCLAASASAASSEARAQLSCVDEATSPQYPPVDSPPLVRFLEDIRVEALPIQPSCYGITLPEPGSFVEVSGTFRSTDEASQLLSRMAKASALLGVRYWSTTDHAWRPLFSAATALTADGRPREDFTASEIESGHNLHVSQTDTRSATPVLYRLTLKQKDSRGFVLEIVNVSPVQRWILTLYAPGALQSVYVLQRKSADLWTYYSLTTLGGGAWLASAHRNSYINRAVALYRHYAGIPTDEEPPPAP
jgi:hypothetical protein